MEDPKALARKQLYIKKHLNPNFAKFKFQNVEISFLEAVFSRGDRRLSEVLLAAFNNGARFDSWNEFFSLSRWMDAFDKVGIDPYSYIRKKDFSDILPWQYIDTGVATSELIKEAKEAHSI
jgi:hypothetical protein